MSLWSIAAKLENVGTKMFLQTYKPLSNFNSNPLICDSTLFPGKKAQILQKVIVFFVEREKETEPLFWHIWIAQWLKFFPAPAYPFFDFGYFQGETSGQSWPKSENFGSISFSWKLESFRLFLEIVFLC